MKFVKVSMVVLFIAATLLLNHETAAGMKIEPGGVTGMVVSGQIAPRGEKVEYGRKGQGVSNKSMSSQIAMRKGVGMVMGGSGVPYPFVIPSMIALSFLLILLAARRKDGEDRDYFKRDFLRGWFKTMLLKRQWRFAFQAVFVFLFLLVIVAGIWGIQISGMNISTVMTWSIWWIGIIFAIMLVGKVWCFVCPWQAIADWLKYLTFWKRKPPALCLNKKWPLRWRNIYLAAGMFVGLAWLELGYGITGFPMATALFALLMLGITIVPNLVYEKGTFCRYGCLVGRISGLYAMFTPMERRAKDKAVCRSECRGKDCLMGNERGYPCPTSMYLGSMELNTYCILCTECVKTCPHDNVSINLRPFAHDLVKSVETRKDESYLAILMLSLTYFHALTMIPLWGRLTEGLGGALSLPYLAAFSMEMVVIMALPALLFSLAAESSRRLAGDRRVSSRAAFVNYAYGLLPITLFFHLAHNVAHLFSEGKRLIVVASDPTGYRLGYFWYGRR